MWLTTTHGFISAVQHRDDADQLIVRARVREDLTNTFRGARVVELPGADYVFRATLRRDLVADRLADYVRRELTYHSHFKDAAIAASEPNAERSAAYYDCWSALARMQPYEPYATTPRAQRRRWWEEDEDW